MAMKNVSTGHRFGSHLSIAGAMSNAIAEARTLGFETVQVFVKNQRQWNATPFKPDDLKLWHATREEGGFGPIVAHATYLINLASADDELAAKSRDAFAEELLRCDELTIPYLVVHPGAAVGQEPAAAIARVGESLNHIFERHPQIRCMPLLETTAGQGSTLGRTFEELAGMIAATREAQRVGVCVDTCHVFAAGYDIRDAAQYEAMIQLAAKTVGIERIRCWHLNDSKGDLGSRIDRHEHIGLGKIGEAGFAHVVNDRRFLGKPMILETPKEENAKGVAWDTINLQRLRALASGADPRPAASGPDPVAAKPKRASRQTSTAPKRGRTRRSARP
ncbi:MAG: deoxyribonuclease IV [Phycisphaerae bacterium]